MRLSAHDGSYLEAHIVRYQFPLGHDNRLLVATWVKTPFGIGRSVDPCWQTEEVRRMVAWFSAMAEDRAVDEWGGACLEANLEFELVATSADTVTIGAHFILERGIWHPADGRPSIPDYGSQVNFELARTDLLKVAQELAHELEQYPPRAPEQVLPSPLR